MDNYGGNGKWRKSTGLAFWGSTIQVIFNLIGTFLVMYLSYNLIDILLEGILPSMVSMSLAYYKDRFSVYFGGALICFFIAFLGYIFYLIGIFIFTGAQRSKDSEIKTRNILLAELIELALTIFFVAYFVAFCLSPKILGIIVEYYKPISIILCVLILAAVIIPMVEFKRLTKEETWSEKARNGADDLKFSYACILYKWLAIILGVGIAALLIYSFINRLASGSLEGVDKYGNTVQRITSVTQAVHDLVAAIKGILLLAIIISLFFAVFQTVYKILGWNKIKSGGMEEISPEDEEYEDEEADNRKKWLLWGGIAAGILAIAAGIWALWGGSGKMEANANVFADRSVVFKSVENGVGIGPIKELEYSREVECRPSDLDKEGIWTLVAFDDDGKVQTGYMSKGDLLNTEDFNTVDRGGMHDNDFRASMPIRIERLALLHALKNAGSDWQLEDLNLYDDRQSNSKRLTVKGVSPSEHCLGFILRNSRTGERTFFLYSTPDIYSPSNNREPEYLYSEPVIGGWDEIHDVTYQKGGKRYEVIYKKTTTETYDPEIFLYEESADEEELESETEADEKWSGSTEMNGFVDGKYPVKIEFTMNADGTVSGTIRYLKYNVPIELIGVYTDEGTYRVISLDERGEGKTVGRYIGQYDGRVFSGIWESIGGDKDKQMPFKVERIVQN